jgi:hypothetical protein
LTLAKPSDLNSPAGAYRDRPVRRQPKHRVQNSSAQGMDAHAVEHRNHRLAIVRLVGLPGCADDHRRPHRGGLRRRSAAAAGLGSPDALATSLAGLPSLCRPHVVVICQKGQKLSQGVDRLAAPRGRQRRRTSKAASTHGAPPGGLLVKTDKLPQRDAKAGARVWVTRARPKVDRIACPWLIRRFVDPNAVFLFVAAVGGDCSCRALQRDAVRHRRRVLESSRRALQLRHDDRGVRAGIAESLEQLAIIVRGADTVPARSRATGGRHSLRPRSACHGCIRDDLEQLEAGMLLYDAFYRWCRDATEETHNWPSAPEAGVRSGPCRPTSRRMNPSTEPLLRRPRRGDTGLGKIGLLSFGGPAGQIALMHKELVESAAGSASSGSCTRSTIACCCPAPRRSSSPPISAG